MEKIIKLPSGSELRLQLASFRASKDLYQAILEEVKEVKFTSRDQIECALKDIICGLFASKKVEAAIWECAKPCLIDKLKFDESYFEPSEKRQDYIEVMYRIAMDNIEPFMKNLYAQFSPILESLKSSQA